MVKSALEEPMVLMVSKGTIHYTHICPISLKLKPYTVCKTTAEYFDLQIYFKVDVASYSVTTSPSNIFTISTAIA